MAEPDTHVQRDGDGADAAWEAALDWLLALQSAPGDSELRRRLDAWLAASASHRRAFAEAEAVWGVTGGLTAHRSAWPGSARRRTRRWPALAAAVLLGLLAALAGPPAWERLQHDYVAGTAERLMAELSDGTQLHLDARSVADFSAAADRRTLTLHRGAAFLDVTADAARPFRVKAGAARITVTGTRFAVRRMAGETHVAVAEGRVRVAHGPDRVLHLHRGQASAGGDTRAVSPDRVAAWRQGRLVLRDATVAEAVARIGHYHRGLIHLADDRLADRRVSGIFDLNDPQAALAAVVAPHSGEVLPLSPWLLVLRD